MDITTVVQVVMAFNTAGLFGALIVGVKIVRHIGRIEERFDLVWEHFKANIMKDRP